MEPEALAVYAETFSDGEALEFAHVSLWEKHAAF